jgi:hypothetical protein
MQQVFRLAQAYTRGHQRGQAIYENNALKELPIYGSSRLGGYRRRAVRVQGGSLENDQNKLTLGRREYELANHLGNVLATVSDAKLPAARVLSFTRSRTPWPKKLSRFLSCLWRGHARPQRGEL